jgi:K(+)-stimulated pyrophosphate-energized sodium pump
MGDKVIDLSVTNPSVLTGLFIGSMLVFVYSAALTMSAVQKAAQNIVIEVPASFVKSRESWKARRNPTMRACVSLCTGGALKAVIVPSLLAVVVPLVTGIILGVKA